MARPDGLCLLLPVELRRVNRGASTNARLTAGILTYSRSKGVFLGVSLKGVAITPDNDLNEAFYGKKASELIETRGDASPPTQVRAFPLALARYSVRLPN